MKEFKRTRMSVLLSLFLITSCPSTGFGRLDRFYKRNARRHIRHIKRMEKKGDSSSYLRELPFSIPYVHEYHYF